MSRRLAVNAARAAFHSPRFCKASTSLLAPSVSTLHPGKCSFPPRLNQARRTVATTSNAVPRILDRSKVPRAVTVEFTNGQQTSFHHLWLRDHCRDQRSYHPATKQRLVDTPKLTSVGAPNAQIPKDLQPTHVTSDHRGLSVTWPSTSASDEAYTSFFPWTFLLEHSYEPSLEIQVIKDDKILWTSDICNDPPMVDYEQVMQSEQGVYEWVKKIHQFGFSFVRGIPPTPEATEALIRRIAFIRETHYGGFWDFTADLKHGDLAYSNVVLNSHTDTTYFTDPCGLQLFHLLSPSTSHSGGHNLLVDGFRAASELRTSHPEIYSFLSSQPIPSHASGSGSSSLPSGVHLKPLSPQSVFNHHPLTGELIQIRWNGDDRAVLGGKGWENGKMELWYESLRIWEGILRSEQSQMWTEMKMGTAVIFDNHRVLHGRSSFTGERRLCGAYINHDDYRSRYIGLHKQFGKDGEETKRRDWEKRFGIERSGTGEKGGVWEEWL